MTACNHVAEVEKSEVSRDVLLANVERIGERLDRRLSVAPETVDDPDPQRLADEMHPAGDELNQELGDGALRDRAERRASLTHRTV